MIHRVATVHYQQVLIDGEDAASFERFGNLCVDFQARDGELLFRVFILFHENHVFNSLVAHLKSFVPGQDYLNDQSDELLQCAIQEHEYNRADCVA